jgi:hypothetical protein
MQWQSGYGHHVVDILLKECYRRLRIKSRRFVKKSSNELALLALNPTSQHADSTQFVRIDIIIQLVVLVVVAVQRWLYPPDPFPLSSGSSTHKVPESVQRAHSSAYRGQHIWDDAGAWRIRDPSDAADAAEREAAAFSPGSAEERHQAHQRQQDVLQGVP